MITDEFENETDLTSEEPSPQQSESERVLKLQICALDKRLAILEAEIKKIETENQSILAVFQSIGERNDIIVAKRH